MSVSGPNAPEPSYRSDFKQTVDLFQKSFEGLQSSSLEPQKEQYIKVMKESLTIMQQLASAMVNQKLAAMKENLSGDLQNYLSSPTKQHEEKVQDDIDRLKEQE